MSCNYYNGNCVFLNGKEDGCIACPIKRAYNKGVRDTKKDYERPTGERLWLGFDDGDSRKWSCSFCGRGVVNQENFCPNCGRKKQVKDDLGGKR